MFNEYGEEFSFADYKDKVDGIPRIDGAKAILKNLSDDEIVEAATKKQEYFRQILDSDEIPQYETTINMIKALKESGIPMGVISSSKNCIYILKKINLYQLMGVVIDGNMITKGKPDPQAFLMASDKLQIEPASCVVFEDAVLGVEAAKNAGMYCIGIDRYEHPERLQKADKVITDVGQISFEELINLL
jgi:beta-phosphoglucomutase